MYTENGVADNARVVVPSDSADLVDSAGKPAPAYGLFVGGAGNLKVTMMGGATDAAGEVTFSGLSAGQFLPINVVRVWATGTTATLILALS